MTRISLPFQKLLSALLLLGALGLSSLSCTTITSLWASPTPTITPSSTPTATPTITPTFTPSPTPEALLSSEERSEYLVILRYVNEDVHKRFFRVAEFLLERGYRVEIDAGPSAIGDRDIILYGALSCNDAIDDLTILLKGKLDIEGLERKRFTTADVSYESKNIVIQIQSINLFGPEF